MFIILKLHASCIMSTRLSAIELIRYKMGGHAIPYHATQYGHVGTLLSFRLKINIYGINLHTLFRIVGSRSSLHYQCQVKCQCNYISVNVHAFRHLLNLS